MRAIGRKYGVTHRAITQRALKEGWTRALAPAIAARAETILIQEDRERVMEANRAQAGAVAVVARDPALDQVVIDHGARMVAEITTKHRVMIQRSRALVDTLMEELAAVTNAPELFAQVQMMLEGAEEVPASMLRSMAVAVESLPGRAKILATLIDSARSVVGMEREAYGMKAQDGTGRALVQIKDFTGTGDPDAPPRPAEDPDD